MKAPANVSKFKIPCYLAIAVLFIFEFTVSSLQLAQIFSSNLDYFTASLYLVFCLGLAAFFITTAVRIFVLLRRLWITSHVDKWTDQEAKMRRQLFYTAIKFSITGVSLLLCVACASLFVVRDVFLQARVWVPLWMTIHTSLNVKALATILAFNPQAAPCESNPNPTRRGSSSRNGPSDSRFSLSLSNYNDTRTEVQSATHSSGKVSVAENT
jgi:hypothetical protein